MSTRELIHLLTDAKPPRALVLGDLMLDRYVWGTTRRISPEAPVPVVRTTAEEERLGGAGNVCANLAAMGARITAAGVVGRDEEGRTLRRLFKELRIGTGAVVTAADRCTTVKSRFIAHDQHILRVDREHDDPIDSDTEKKVIQKVVEGAAKADVIVISDYVKGLLTRPVIRAAISAARKAKIPVLVDPKFRDWRIYRGATVIKPNLREFHHAIGDDGPGAQQQRRLTRAARKLLERLTVGALVITLGKAGMLLVPRGNGKARWFAAAEQETYDVTGAGDTALAALSYLLGTGAPLPEAVQIANVAGGAAVAKVGTAPVGRREIVHRLEEAGRSVGAKTKTLDELLPRLHAHRSRREKVVFTNGCFDVLHVGHIGLLKYARKQGDVLVVGLNADRSVTRLKGPGRPILDQEARARILAALQDVDYIVLFEESSVLPLVKRLRPDILVKGADYRHGEVVGQAFVESYGGKVKRAPLVQGVSTTHIVDKIKRKDGGHE